MLLKFNYYYCTNLILKLQLLTLATKKLRIRSPKNTVYLTTYDNVRKEEWN